MGVGFNKTDSQNLSQMPAAVLPSSRDDFIPAQIDFNLRGLVGIRVLNASPRDAALIRHQLGPIEAPLSGDPDIVIRFVDRLATASRIRYLGLDDAGFTDNAFLVLQSNHGSRTRVQIPFEQIGKQCEIVCETGVPKVPLLAPILNLTMLSKGVIPLHASAFTYNGTGVIAAGWAKGGKTETLLAFMAKGAAYVGDEWVYLSADGRKMYGSPRHFGVWDWHLACLPQYRTLISRGDRARLKSIKLFTQLMDLALPGLPERKVFPIQAMNRLTWELKQKLNVGVSPQRLFGEGFHPFEGTPDKLFFAVSHETPEIVVRPVDPREVARRMVFSLQYERMKLMSCYLKFRFAFPDACNELIEGAEELERQILTRVLDGKEAYTVSHPYPVHIPDLFEAIAPYINRSSRVSPSPRVAVLEQS
jgi:hypothetical protein